jgi:hypothetical protein
MKLRGNKTRKQRKKVNKRYRKGRNKYGGKRKKVKEQINLTI